MSKLAASWLLGGRQALKRAWPRRAGVSVSANPLSARGGQKKGGEHDPAEQAVTSPRPTPPGPPVSFPDSFLSLFKISRCVELN